MNYFQISINISETPLREQIIAQLDSLGIEGFEESENSLKAFVAETDYNKEEIAALLNENQLTFSIEEIEQKNWNAQWESDFEPVIVGDFCTLRAHFHSLPITTKHEVIITPKMSFGTGHHATTYLMVEQMEHLDFVGKKVLDFGTGTGILAILAEKLGAENVTAIDNDEWSFDNAKENVGLNNCSKIAVSLDDIESLSTTLPFDLILANINRHILLQYMHTMYALLAKNGTLLMSGLLIDDEEIISKAATEEGFALQTVETRNGWICILCTKA